jgi:hypothetical protein
VLHFASESTLCAFAVDYYPVIGLIAEAIAAGLTAIAAFAYFATISNHDESKSASPEGTGSTRVSVVSVDDTAVWVSYPVFNQIWEFEKSGLEYGCVSERLVVVPKHMKIPLNPEPTKILILHRPPTRFRVPKSKISFEEMFLDKAKFPVLH